MSHIHKKTKPAHKPALSFEYAEDKIDIFALLQQKKAEISISESSSTESMKRVNKGKSSKPPIHSYRTQKFPHRKHVSTDRVFATSFGNSSARCEGLKAAEESEDTVIKSIASRARGSGGSLGGKNELSGSMLEILKNKNTSEYSKEIKKLQTRLQVLQVYNQFKK